MSKPARAWVVVGSVCVVGSVVWLIVSPAAGFDGLAWFVLAVGLVILVIAAIGGLMPFTDPEIHVPDRPLRLGEPFSVSYRQGCKRATDVSRIRFELVLRETVQYQKPGGEYGSTTVTKSHDDVEQGLAVAGRRFVPGQTINETCAFQIPVNGMHTFDGYHNRIEWYVVAHVETPKWGDLDWEEKLTVLPELAG